MLTLFWVTLGIVVFLIGLVGFSCISLSGKLSRIEEEEEERE